jgi:hypothetical protein
MTFTALVMAASRRGAADPVAQTRGVAQKSLAPVAGLPMLSHVLRNLRASKSIGDIYVSIEDAGLLGQVPDGGLATAVPSAPTLAASVTAAVTHMPAPPWPLLITTADNALHTPEIIDTFCAGSRARGADVTVAMTPADVILAKYPTGQRAFHHFKDGDASSCNMYALMNDRALASAQAFAGGGQFGKKPWRLISVFGAGTFLLHILRRLTLDDAMARAGAAFGLNIEAVRVPIAEGPIDIDNVADLELAEAIFRQRASESTDR